MVNELLCIPQYNTPTNSPFDFSELWIKDCDILENLFEKTKAMIIEFENIKEVIWNEYCPRNFNKIISESIAKDFILINFYNFLKNIEDIIYINLYTPGMLYRIKVRHQKLYFMFFKSANA